MQRFFKVVINTEIFQSGLVVMGDLSRLKKKRVGEKYKDFFQIGEKCRDFSKW